MATCRLSSARGGFRLGHDDSAERQAGADADGRVGHGAEQRGGEVDAHAAVGGVVLGVPPIGEARVAPAFEADRFVNAGGEGHFAPVPTALAGLFADVTAAGEAPVAARFGFVPGGQMVFRLAGAGVGQDRAEGDAQAVSADAQVGFHVPAPVAEHVVGAGDFHAVDLDGGEGVESVAAEFDAIIEEQLGADFEVAFIEPVLFGDPLLGVFVKTPVQVAEDAGVQQGVMDGAGHGRGDRRLRAVGGGNGPGAVERESLHRT